MIYNDWIELLKLSTIITDDDEDYYIEIEDAKAIYLKHAATDWKYGVKGLSLN